MSSIQRLTSRIRVGLTTSKSGSYSFHTTQQNVDHMETFYYLTEHLIGSHKKLLFICDIQKVTRLCIIFLRCREKEKKRKKVERNENTKRDRWHITPSHSSKVVLKDPSTHGETNVVPCKFSLSKGFGKNLLTST